ncbi:MAG: hypothetical protein ACRDX9_07830 [Acidimicrobiia bacterium]
MGIGEVIEFGLANAGEGRVELTALEPAEVDTEAVAGLAQLFAQLAASSTPDERVVVSGTFDGENYLVSMSAISSDGPGLLNRMWGDPELAHGLAVAARVAARLGLDVEFLTGGVQVSVPARLVTRIASERPRPTTGSTLQAVPEEAPDDFVPHELGVIGHGPSRSESSWSDSEAFLEEVFAPLMKGWDDSGGTASVSSLGEREAGNVAVLGVRVPGESYSLTEDDSPSTAAAEGAVDLKSALSTYDQGRRSAQRRDVG